MVILLTFCLLYVKILKLCQLRLTNVSCMGEYFTRRYNRIMDVSKILVELRQESQQLQEAIETLERLARGRGKRRGRIGKTSSSASAPVCSGEVKRKRGRPPGSKNKRKVPGNNELRISGVVIVPVPESSNAPVA